MEVLGAVLYFTGVVGMMYVGYTVLRDVAIMKRQLARIDSKCSDRES
jgi:hypothetical protein